MEENASLIGLPVSRDDYRADLDLLDRQAKLSAQLMCLAVLGLIGFLHGAGLNVHPRIAPLLWASTSILGFLGFSAALLLGIAHRYYALDLLHDLLRVLRLRNAPATRSEESPVKREEGELREDAQLVRRLLAGCVLGTVIGVTCFTLRVVFVWFGL
jgi:hypothetical protein